MAVAVIVVPVLSAAERLIASLTDLRAKRKNSSTTTAEVDKFIGSLNENVDLLKEHLPEQSESGSTWAIGTYFPIKPTVTLPTVRQRSEDFPWTTSIKNPLLHINWRT